MTARHALAAASVGLVVAFAIAVGGAVDGIGGRIGDHCRDIYGDGSSYVTAADGAIVKREADQAYRRLHGAELEYLESCGDSIEGLGRGPGG